MKLTVAQIVDKIFVFYANLTLVAAFKTPNLEDQVIFFRGFLPLAFTDPSVNRKAAALVLVCPGYFISPVPSISGERSLIRHPGRHPMEDQ